jgi:PAS domain S-box-containing protein
MTAGPVHEVEAEVRALEQALHQARADNAGILERINDAYTAFDRGWRFVAVNERAVKLLGKAREELLGRVVWDLFPQDVGTDHYHQFRNAMNERVPLVFDGFSPGSNRWYTNHVYPTRDGLECYWSDTTDIRRAQQELQRSEAYLAEGEKISHTGSWAWNLASGTMFWSLEHFRICGLDPTEFTPTIVTAPRIVHPEDLPAVQRAWEDAVRQQRDYTVQFRVLRPDLSVRHVRSVGHPVFGDQGELIEYVGTIVDLTEQKHAEEAVNEARAELAHVNRALTMGELAASIAHELNQPLAAIATNAHACERWLSGPAPNVAEANESLHRISRDAIRASAVIARIRALLARRPRQAVELGIEEVIRDVLALVQREAQAKGVQLQLIPAEGTLPPVLADRVELQQVLLNLVMNGFEAMGATEGARILTLGAERFGNEGVAVSVCDTGVGVDATLADRIFDAFFTTKADGMGMGLAIARSIVDAHGGRLWARNNEGGGATFRFTVPARLDTDSS